MLQNFVYNLENEDAFCPPSGYDQMMSYIGN